MLLTFLIFPACLAINPALSAVCKREFEETVCENFEFSPETVLDISAANKLIIQKAKGGILTENLSKNSATELIVKKSELTQIEPEALCSSNLTSLTFVENKKIPKITRKVLKNCQRLVKVYLDGPEVVVENGAFSEADNLQTLTLNETTFPEVLEREFFHGLDSLKSLTIRHSNLRKIKGDTFEKLKNLKFLDLQNNELEEIGPGAFHKLLELKVLNLADNKLKNLHWEEFKGLNNLRVLYLERNNIRDVDVNKLVETVPDLERIFLSYDKLSPENRKQIEEILPKHNITVIFSESNLF